MPSFAQLKDSWRDFSPALDLEVPVGAGLDYPLGLLDEAGPQDITGATATLSLRLEPGAAVSLTLSATPTAAGSAIVASGPGEFRLRIYPADLTPHAGKTLGGWFQVNWPGVPPEAAGFIRLAVLQV